jgi:hypothetical protein
MKPRHAHGYELEAYFVFSQPVPSVENPLKNLKLEAYPNDDTSFRAARLTGDADPDAALETLRALLLSGTVRWLELGLRGYSFMDGKREYRPWRSNAHLSLDALLELTHLEPEMRYHAPV